MSEISHVREQATRLSLKLVRVPCDFAARGNVVKGRATEVVDLSPVRLRVSLSTGADFVSQCVRYGLYDLRRNGDAYSLIQVNSAPDALLEGAIRLVAGSQIDEHDDGSAFQFARSSSE